MSDTMRWRYGETNPVVMSVDAEQEIEIGDLVIFSNGAQPANQVADAGTEAANQEAFHDLFGGVAMQRSRLGDTNPIRVATTGVFEFPCPSSSFEVGALIGASEAASGDVLLNQQVEGVATANLAIGRCAKRTVSATSVLVQIVGTISHGGPQTVA